MRYQITRAKDAARIPGWGKYLWSKFEHPIRSNQILRALYPHLIHCGQSCLGRRLPVVNECVFARAQLQRELDDVWEERLGIRDWTWETPCKTMENGRAGDSICFHHDNDLLGRGLAVGTCPGKSYEGATV